MRTTSMPTPWALLLVLLSAGCGGSGGGGSTPPPVEEAAPSPLAGDWHSMALFEDPTLTIDAGGRVTADYRGALPAGLRYVENEMGLYEATHPEGHRVYAVLDPDTGQYLLLMWQGQGGAFLQRTETPDPAPVTDDMVRASFWSGVALTLDEGGDPVAASKARFAIEPEMAFTVSCEDGRAPIKSLANTMPVTARDDDERVYDAGFLLGAEERRLFCSLSDDQNGMICIVASLGDDETTVFEYWLLRREVELLR